MTDKVKKDQKYLEKLLKELFTLGNKEKQKIEICQKLIEIFDNCIDINLNFDLLISSIDDLHLSLNLSTKKIWLRIILCIIRFRNEYRLKLFDKLMTIIFSLPKDDYITKARAIQMTTNNCLESNNYSKEVIVNFLFFECILTFQYFKKFIFISLLNLIQNDYETESHCITKFLLDLIVENSILIMLNKIINLQKINIPSTPIKEKDNYFQSSNQPQSNDNKIDDEKQIIKSIMPLFDFYCRTVNTHKINLFKGIILMYCYINNIEREYSWKAMKNLIVLFPRKVFSELLEVLTSKNLYLEFSSMDKYLFYDFVSEANELILLDTYIPYIKSSQENITQFLYKSKSKFITGAVFFIGMAVWGYEKIESLDVSYSIVLTHLVKLVKENNKTINKDVIFCLKRLIKKYGEVLTDEWEDILLILFLVIEDINKYISKYQHLFVNISSSFINDEKGELVKSKSKIMSITSQVTNYIDISYKNICEIIDSVKLLILLDKFYGNKTAFNMIIEMIKVPKLDLKRQSAQIYSSFTQIGHVNTFQLENKENKDILTTKNQIFELYNISKNIYKITNTPIFELESLIIDYLIK